MTVNKSFATLIAVGLFAATLAAYANGATIPDPNLAPTSTAGEPALVATNANTPQLAAIPNPDLASTTSEAAPALLATDANSAELAAIPDPNLAPSANDEAQSRWGMVSVRLSSAK